MAHLALADFSDDELDEGDDIVVTDGAIVPRARSLTMSMPSTEMARPAISLSRTGLRLAQDYEGGSPMQPARRSAAISYPRPYLRLQRSCSARFLASCLIVNLTMRLGSRNWWSNGGRTSITSCDRRPPEQRSSRSGSRWVGAVRGASRCS